MLLLLGYHQLTPCSIFRRMPRDSGVGEGTDRDREPRGGHEGPVKHSDICQSLERIWILENEPSDCSEQNQIHFEFHCLFPEPNPFIPEINPVTEEHLFIFSHLILHGVAALLELETRSILDRKTNSHTHLTKYRNHQMLQRSS